MKKFKFNFTIWLFCAFFIVTTVLGAIAAFMFFTFKFSPLNKLSSIGLGILIITIIASHIFSLIMLITRYIKNKKLALIFTEKGIEDTFAIFIFTAYIFIIPIKLIPWRAVYKYKEKSGTVYIKADPKYLNCSKLLKLYFRFFSYDCGNILASPRVTVADIEKYKIIKMPKKKGLFF